MPIRKPPAAPALAAGLDPDGRGGVSATLRPAYSLNSPFYWRSVYMADWWLRQDEQFPVTVFGPPDRPARGRLEDRGYGLPASHGDGFYPR
jgi:hypothetical protein